jgi:hypothetical protein
VVVNMPRKRKPSKPIASPDEVWIAPRRSSGPEPRTSDKGWIAPRPPSSSEFKTFAPAGIDRSNRYLEFAAIALGGRKKKTGSTESRPGRNQDRKSNVTSIDSHRPSKRGFGAFRNSR